MGLGGSKLTHTAAPDQDDNVPPPTFQTLPRHQSMVPPATGWHGTPRMSAMDELYRDELTVSHCQAQPAPTTATKAARGQRERRGGLKVMMERPGTHLMLGINMYIAWVLYSKNVPVERVALSYERVVRDGEYWRGVTASLAHYDIMHLGFNMMSLYNLGKPQHWNRFWVMGRSAERWNRATSSLLVQPLTITDTPTKSPRCARNNAQLSRPRHTSWPQ